MKNKTKADVVFVTMKDSAWEHYYDNIKPHLDISYEHVYIEELADILRYEPLVAVSVFNFNEWSTILIPKLKEAGVATLLIQEGATEWMMNWENPRLAKQIPPRHRPVMYDKIAVMGPLYRRIDESWGNLGKCEMVGAPRLDNLITLKRKSRKGQLFRLLLASARVVGYDEKSIKKTIKGFKELNNYLKSRSDIEVLWRVGDRIQTELNLQNNDQKLDGLTVAETLQQIDAVICTPSTFLIESMISGCPVASLDYVICPRYFNPAWTIHCEDDIETVIDELMDPPVSKMMYQKYTCDDVIYKPGGAGKRAAKLIHELAIWAKNGRKSESLPSSILEDTTWPPYLPPKGLSLSELFPEHPMFTEQKENEMRAELAMLREKFAQYPPETISGEKK